MQWGQCMLQCFLSELQMLLLFNLQSMLKGLSHIEKEQLECIQRYHLHWLRSVRYFVFMHPFYPVKLTVVFNHINNFYFLKCHLQIVIEFPYVYVQSVIYSIIFYSMASFEQNLLKFVWYIYFMYFTLLYFTFFGMMTISVTPNQNIAAIVAAPFYMMWNLFSGFMIARMV